MTEAVAVPYPLGEADYSVPPGETLRELLEEQNISQRELARRADLSPKHVNRLIQGLVPLSADIAQRLELVTGTPARIWNTLEANYRSDLERLRSRQALAVDVGWLGELPVKVLVDRGSLPDQPSDKPSRMEQMLRFFGVASVGAWHDIYADTACAFRQTRAYEAKAGSVATWLRLGEIAAQDVYCKPYDAKAVESALPDLRALTRQAPETFRARMRDICAACGIAVVFVEEIPGARASGVTRWLTPAKALVQLSLRYRTDDHLWFTFFHEVGHLLRHGKTQVWIEDGPPSGEDPREAEEAEADRFSRDLLISPRDAKGLSALKTIDDVQRFADRIGIASSIVVGRLQHDNLWPHSRGNRLKTRLALT